MSRSFDRERMRSRLGAVIVPLITLLVGLGIGYVAAERVGKEPSTTAEVGPTDARNGVPVGYAQTRDGAVAAAINFEQVRSGPLIAKGDSYKSAVSTMATPEWEQRGLSAASRDSANVTERYGSNVEVDSSILRYKVESFSSTKARVTVWLVSIFHPGNEGLAESVWSNVTYVLRWHEGDWRVSDARASESLVPQPFQEPKARDVRDFERTRNAPS